MAVALTAVCLAMVGALFLPGGASAKGGFSGTFAGGGQGGPEFSLGKKGGTKLTVSTEGQQVTADFESAEQSVSYKVRGRVARGGIRANFGRAGRLAVKFEPSGPAEPVEQFPFCKSRPPETVTHGLFTGVVDLTGFDHFAHFHATRVHGTVTRAGKVHCHFPGGNHPHKPENGGKKEEQKSVALTVLSPDKRLGFVAVTEKDVLRSFALFVAASKETVGRVHVKRFALLFSPRPADFTFDEALTTAAVTPPAPFRGGAEFLRGAAGTTPSWKGTLRVAFLDRTLALTGKGFKATLEEPRQAGGRAFRVP